MARLFFIFWICSNIFRKFSGCRRSILISETIIRFFFPLAFQCRIPNYSTAKTREDIAKRKWKTMVRLFFIFWIRSNKFSNFSGCRRSILISETIIRFVFPLAFQCRIRNYSTAKTREDITKRKRKTMVRFTVWIRKSANFPTFLWMEILQLYASRCIIFLNRTCAIKKHYARVL